MINVTSLFNIWYRRILLSLVGLLTACASPVPKVIQTEPANTPMLAKVLKQPKTFLEQRLRWGGVIINTENLESTTRLTILALPLDNDGEPRVDDPSYGRFIAVFTQFLEPSIYTQDRKIAVLGRLKSIETLKVGEYDYPHPVVQVEHHYLWPKIKPVSDHDWPPYWWYDPWYHPYYYPYYPYPYHPRRR